MEYIEEPDGEYVIRVYEDDTKEWWLNGERHREDGPAVERRDGNKSWWLNGKCVLSKYEDHLSDFPDLPEEFKKSIIKHKLKRM